MTTFQLILAGSGLVMLICALLLFTDKGAARRHLRERVLATREYKSQQAVLAESLMYNPIKQSLLLKLASWLGYQSDLPPGYAAAPHIIVPVAGVIGFIVSRLTGHLVAEGPAIATGVVVSIILARYLFKRKSNIYTSLLFKQIPDTMSLMLRAVRAGLPIAEAIRSVGRESMSPTKDEFARVAGEAALGSPIEVAMRRLADRTKVQEYAFFAVIIGLHAQTGGNLSETLENMADIVRRRVAMAARGKALSAEGRLSAGVVGALPFVVAIAMLLFNPSYLNEFLTNPNGPMLISVFVILLGTGTFITHMLIQRSSED